jgi:DNA-binding transcriptional ArsR family regulator
MFDQQTIIEIIADGLAEGAAPTQIAQQIIELSEDPGWARAHSHPTRRAILKFLRAHGSASPSRTARHLDAENGAVAYHFRALERLGMIELADKVHHRGAVEHIYRLRETSWAPAATIKPPSTPRRGARTTVANPGDYVTVADAAAQADVTEQTIRNWIRAGHLTSARVDRRTAVNQRDLMRLLGERQAPTPDGSAPDASS